MERIGANSGGVSGVLGTASGGSVAAWRRWAGTRHAQSARRPSAGITRIRFIEYALSHRSVAPLTANAQYSPGLDASTERLQWPYKKICSILPAGRGDNP